MPVPVRTLQHAPRGAGAPFRPGVGTPGFGGWAGLHFAAKCAAYVLLPKKVPGYQRPLPCK